MKVLVYAAENSASGKKMLTMIESMAQIKELVSCQTTDALAQRLREPRNRLSAAVLLPSDKEDLLKILMFDDLFLLISVILVLPDRDKETISKGHILHPRYLTFADSNFRDVVAVLLKILEKIQAQERDLMRKGNM